MKVNDTGFIVSAGKNPRTNDCFWQAQVLKVDGEKAFLRLEDGREGWMNKSEFTPLYLRVFEGNHETRTGAIEMTDTKPEALQSLIEDLTLNHEYCTKETILNAATELRRLHEVNEALLEFVRAKEEKQEPVKCTCGFSIGHPLVSSCSCKPRKPWVGLTSEDWENLPDTGKQGCERDAEIFDWIEAKLKEKNNAI